MKYKDFINSNVKCPICNLDFDFNKLKKYSEKDYFKTAICKSQPFSSHFDWETPTECFQITDRESSTWYYMTLNDMSISFDWKSKYLNIFNIPFFGKKEPAISLKPIYCGYDYKDFNPLSLKDIKKMYSMANAIRLSKLA